MAIEKIISGGQTGVDRAALDAAMAAGIVVGGYCPKGRLAEDGAIDERYPLTETATPEYAMRTEMNVKSADGTLILAVNDTLEGGTKLTYAFCTQHNKPCLALNLKEEHKINRMLLHHWLNSHKVTILNVAGPRESTCPGIYVLAYKFLSGFLKR